MNKQIYLCKVEIIQISRSPSKEQPIGISNFHNEIFVYSLFESFYKVKVSIEVKIHHSQ